MENHQETVIKGNCYFAADFHLGTPDAHSSAQREQLIIEWLDAISSQVNHLFLLGDIFDFWFEYHDKAMEEYRFFLNKLIELKEKGVEIYFFTGNHDMWAKKYFPSIGIKLFREPRVFMINGKKIMLGHGDGLGNKTVGYSFIKWLFSRTWTSRLYSLIPQKIGKKIAFFCSKSSRKYSSDAVIKTFNIENEYLFRYCKQQLLEYEMNFFIFGHRHLPIVAKVSDAVYYNVGDWLTTNSYVSFFENDLHPTLSFYKFKIL